MSRSMINNESAKLESMTVKELLVSRGVKDEKGLVKKAAKEKGFNLDQTIDDFMKETARSDPKLAELYKNPMLADLESAFDLGHGGQVATIAVMAVAVAVVAVAAAAITQRAREYVLREIDVSQEINLLAK